MALQESNYRPKADVESWNASRVYVFCPWCDMIHDHPFEFDKNYHKPQKMKAMLSPCSKMEYLIKFPNLGSDDPLACHWYEIDKDEKRFVAGGARPIIMNPSTAQIAEKRKIWEGHVSQKKTWATAAGSARKSLERCLENMRKGHVDPVKKYLADCAPDEKALLLFGVGPLGISGHSKVGESPGQPTGETALHVAAGQPYPSIVSLLLEHHVEVDALDVNGRTALMEAVSEGHLENVEILMKERADASLMCIHQNRMQCAADLAKTRESAMHLRERCYSFEDDRFQKRRRDKILRLLEGQSAYPTAFLSSRRDLIWPDATSSLTVYFEPRNPYKTIGFMMRGGMLPNVTAMSGWSPNEHPAIDLLGETWTEEAWKLCKRLGHTLTSSGKKDGGIPGRHEACHAEKQLIAYFVHKHVFIELDRPVARVETAESLEANMSKLSINHKDRQDEEEKERLEELQKLKRVQPESHLKGALIVTTSPVCESCKKFIQFINKELGLELRLKHTCSDRQCQECSWVE